MAAYFTGGGGTDIQAADGLQTLYLMNPGYAGFTTDPNNSAPDHAHPTNMVLLNSMTSLNPVTLSTQMSPTGSPHIVGIPLQHEAASRSPTQPQPQPHVQYNLWAQQQQQGASNNPAQQGGLSLTLSSRELSVPASAIAPTQLATASSSSGGMHMPGGYMMSGSKYLKAAQELLDEVVSVGKVGAKVVDSGKGASSSTGKLGSGKKDNKEELAEMSASGGEEDKKPAAVELTTAERQEMQMKKAKLVNMLDEVEQRYRQYHHQMQVIASSFEAVAGPGSARTYTSLALQTISKQFRCLRDAITAQIRSTSKSLGEEESKTVGSRLRFIDHQLRQQRALQQLGMVQHNAWRPQRGLPERSVSILRAWLFEHFLHPYPKDSDKIMLAKQTGLTRSQVSNWFINARVRLWKPMVEEMYLEETKDQEKDVDNTDAGENSSGNTDITDKNLINSNSATQQNSIGSKLAQQQNTLTNSINQIHSAAMLTDHQPESFYAAAHDEELMPQQKVKRVRCEEEAYQPGMVASSVGVDQPRHHHHEQVNNRELLMKFMEEGARVGFGSTAGYTMAAAADPMARLINPEQFAPHMSYGGNNGVVSLTLGLPHCDTHMPMSGAHHQQSFLSSNDVGIRLEMGTEANVDYCSSLGGNSAPVVTVAPHTTSNAAYDIDLQSRKPFSAHLMRDFVA